MIRSLSLQNIAIARSLTVEFSNGLNIITGETGAGKSLLVDALALLRGSKADPVLVRSGCENAQVVGVFVCRNEDLVAHMKDIGVVSADEKAPTEVILKRQLHVSGRNRSFVNDTPVSNKTLQKIASDLIDISSQFENQRLLDPGSHTWFLDAYAGTQGLAMEVGHLYQKLHDGIRQWETLKKDIQQHERESDLYSFELQQIEASGLSDKALAECERIVSLGQRSQQGLRLCAEAEGVLAESEGSAIHLLRQLKKTVDRLTRLTPGVSLPVKVSAVEEALAQIEELTDCVHRTAQHFEIDDEALERASHTLEEFNRLLHRYGPSVADVAAYREKCLDFLNTSDDLVVKCQQLEMDIQHTARDVMAKAHALSHIRQAHLQGMQDAIASELSELGMPKARFVCALTPHEPAAGVRGSALGDAARLPFLPPDTLQELTLLQRSGYESADFLLSANAGMAPAPLERVASGGELSRIMLAIKTVLFHDTGVSVFVFDEIDTGISGHVASKVGRKLSEFCSGRQSICITHLPQVACHAHTHLVARKVMRDGEALSEVVHATPEERLQQLALMLSGEHITPASLQQARSLIEQAQP